MRTFTDRIAESRRKTERKIRREFANYPQVLELAEAMMSCPNCSDVSGELERIPGIDMSRLELALDNLGAGLYIRDTAGKILYANKCLVRMLRTDRESLLGHDTSSSAADPVLSEGMIEQLMSTGSYTGIVDILRQDNTRMGVVVWCYVIKNAHGGPAGIIALIHSLDACREMVNKLFVETSMIFDATKETC